MWHVCFYIGIKNTKISKKMEAMVSNKQKSFWLLTFLFVACLLSACHVNYQLGEAANKTDGVLVSSKLVHTLYLSGSLNLVIKKSPPNQATRLIVPYQEDEHDSVHWDMQKDVLHLFATHATKKPIILCIHYLSYLSVKDTVTVDLQDVETHALVLDDRSYGNITLNGNINIRHIHKSGEGELSIRWIHSPILKIYSDAGVIKLAGKTHKLVARLSGEAKLIAPSLRANTIWIISKDDANAHILPLTTLDAFAYNYSHINYYKRPKNLNIHNEQKATVLHLDEWE